MGVEVEEDGLEVEWVACAEAVGELGEGEADMEKFILYLSIVEGREQIKDGVNLCHPVGDDVTRKGDNPHRRAKESEALGWGPWNPTVERVSFRWRKLAAPD